MAELVALGRRDLLGFDHQARALVEEMQSYGWRGRISSKGHALLYSPDGSTSGSVSRASKRGRSGRNMRRALNRWLKSVSRGMMQMQTQEKDNRPIREEQSVTTALIDEPTTTSTAAPFECPDPDCIRRFATAGALALHRTSHSTTKHKCPKCPRTFTNLGARAVHIKRTHPAGGDAAQRGPYRKTSKRLKCPVCPKIAAPQGMSSHLNWHLKRGDVQDGQVLHAVQVPDAVVEQPSTKPAAAAAAVELVEPSATSKPAKRPSPLALAALVEPAVVEQQQPAAPAAASVTTAKPAPWSAPDPTMEAEAQLAAIRALVSASVVEENAKLRANVAELTELLSISERERGELQAKVDIIHETLGGLNRP